MSSLAEQEAIIERGLVTFREVGHALQVIRDEQLYPHRAFEVYCVERWGMTPERGRQLIDAAEMATMVAIPNERVARELMPVLRQRGREAVLEVVAQASASGPLSASVVRRVAQAALNPIDFGAEPPPTEDYALLMERLESVAQLAATLDSVLLSMTHGQHTRLRTLVRRVDRQVLQRLDADRVLV